MEDREEAERRDYFRIDDRVLLDYRAIEPDALTQPVEQHFPPSSTFDLIRDLRALEHEHSPARGGSDHDREFDQQLRLLHRKIDLVAATLVAIEQNRAGREAVRVSLSEGGIAFPADAPLPLGTPVALQIQLLPELVGLHLYGEVIHDQSLLHWEDCGHASPIAVRFLQLREVDRQLLARHILKSQINARRERQQRD